ncbi:MAG TPA: LysR substrate-binding domain-containing protein [Alphaproteobacteria bacterium]|nr:LysR substrate-binding domain-containing protein [Alphaproteobacteria bacterium]
MALPPRIQMNALRAVEAVGRLGSLGRAAAELGVSPGAVSQQLRKAEDQLGFALFERGPAGLSLTPAGRRIMPGLEQGFRSLADAVALVTADAEGSLTITAGAVIGARWLVPRLAEFQRLHPDLRFRFVSTGEVLDLAHSDVDLGLRLGGGSWPGTRSELLVRQVMYPVCAPQWRAALQRPEDLARVPVVFDEGAMFRWEGWFAAAGVPMPPLTGPAFTDPVLALDAAIAGQGVMLGWDLILRDALRDGRLVRPFPVEAESGLAYWFVTAEGRRETAKVRAFKAWIKAKIAEG